MRFRSSSVRRSRSARLAATAAASLVGLALLAGCGNDESAGSDTAANGEARDGFPVTVQNCGIDVTVEAPPERVYAAYQPAVEIAHALGITDRLIETAYLDSQVLPEYVEAQKGVAYVEKLPSRDALLATNPDFIFSGFNGVFSTARENGFGTRASLAELGIQTWILSPLCPSEDGLSDEAIDPATVNLETLHEDLRLLGKLFGVEERAETVIAEQNKRIAAVAEAVKDAERPTVAIISPRKDGTFSASSGIDFGSRIIEAAGGVNAFEYRTEKRNVKFDEEELIRLDPDFILTSTCCDASYTPEDALGDVQTIVDNPAFAGLSAVQNDRVLPFLFADRSASVRAAHAVELVASYIHPDLVG